ncbi:MAG: EamA family transporter [Coriobacteriia bacterium]|nr:EamA family transporter [Coriobacteriia bacterium]
MRRRGALVAVVVSAACFGTLAVLTPLAYRAWPGGSSEASPLTLLAWRFLIASAAMGVYALARDARSLRVDRRDLLRYAALALTGYGAASICFFFALRHAPAPVVSVLLYTYPVLVALSAGVLYREAFPPVRVAGVAAAFAGCVLVVDPFSAAGRPETLGIVLGLGAAGGYAAFSVLSQRWVSRRPRLVLMTYTFGFAGLATAALALATGAGMSVEGWGIRLWTLLAAIVAVPTFAAVVLYLEGIRGLGAAQAALVSTLEPLVTIVLAWAVLGQGLRLGQLSGVALVLAGVVAAELGARRAQEPAAV